MITSLILLACCIAGIMAGSVMQEPALIIPFSIFTPCVLAMLVWYVADKTAYLQSLGPAEPEPVQVLDEDSPCDSCDDQQIAPMTVDDAMI